jgi:hypothetical protein
MSTRATRPGPTLRQLRRELDLVEAAIRMVSSGDASRISLGALTFGEPLLGRARRMAARAGVRVTPLWTASDGGAIGLVVERDGDDPGS